MSRDQNAGRILLLLELLLLLLLPTAIEMSLSGSSPYASTNQNK